MDVDFDSLEARESDIAASAAHPETARLLSELDRRQLARKIALPTNDGEVRARLRELDEPVTLFGEGPADRRDRLRDLIAKARLERGEAMDVEEEEESESESEESDKEEEFYTEGPAALKKARRDIAEYSLPRCALLSLLLLPLSPVISSPSSRSSLSRARKRLARQRLDAGVPLARLMDVRKAVFSNLSTFTNLGSQIGDTRAISAVRFSPDSSMLLTGSWTGQAKLWSVPSCKEVRVLKGQSLASLPFLEVACLLTEYHRAPAAHKERIGGVAWHPEATLSQSASAVNFATSGADNDVKLWNLESCASLPSAAPSPPGPDPSTAPPTQ